jgi:hypothetical protein
MAYRHLLQIDPPADLALVESLLESEKIPHHAHGEDFALLRLSLEPIRAWSPAKVFEPAADPLRSAGFHPAPAASHSDSVTHRRVNDLLTTGLPVPYALAEPSEGAALAWGRAAIRSLSLIYE